MNRTSRVSVFLGLLVSALAQADTTVLTPNWNSIGATVFYDFFATGKPKVSMALAIVPGGATTPTHSEYKFDFAGTDGRTHSVVYHEYPTTRNPDVSNLLLGSGVSALKEGQLRVGIACKTRAETFPTQRTYRMSNRLSDSHANCMLYSLQNQ
jgi:hypothetical protein